MMGEKFYKSFAFRLGNNSLPRLVWNKPASVVMLPGNEGSGRLCQPDDHLGLTTYQQVSPTHVRVKGKYCS